MGAARLIPLPARTNPYWMFRKPSRITAAPAILRKCFWNAPLAKLEIAESDNKAGKVPSAKINMVNAPFKKLPVDKV